jgi:membrane-bound lytic murein transglycosylase D
MRHKANLRKILLGMVIVAAIIVSTDTQLLSWGLFNLFTDTQFSEEGLEKVRDFDPDRDILYLPAIGNKDIFEASRDLSVYRNRAVRMHVYLYLTSKREYLVRAIRQSYIYEDAIREILKQNGDLPEELGLLPLLESCFNPYAVSSSRAVGLWQFLENTSRPLGLKSDRWVDERRSVEKSTAAAFRHLRSMRSIFPRWDLALAAYNGGAGYVRRTMDGMGVKDYWQLRDRGLIRPETAEYVPKFIALMLIYKNQRLFGVADEVARPEKTETAYVTLERPVDLKDVERLSGVPVRTIRGLNPELNSTLTPPAAKNYRLNLPAEAKKKLEGRERELYRNSITGVIEHRVRKGETITKIARMYKKKLIAFSGLTA